MAWFSVAAMTSGMPIPSLHVLRTWETLIIGLLVYYLGVPLLLDLFFDFNPTTHVSLTGGGIGETAAYSRFTAKVMAEHLVKPRAILSTLDTIVTPAAPSIYSYFAHQKLLINYFDRLQALLNLIAR